MTSFVNSFALLEGDTTATAVASSKKKKSKKAKNPAPVKPPSAKESEVAVHASAPEEQSAVDDGFQLAGKTSRRNSSSNLKPPAAAVSPKQRSVTEGITDLENAANRVPVKDPAERVTLWTSWQQQVLSNACFSSYLVRLPSL